MAHRSLFGWTFGRLLLAGLVAVVLFLWLLGGVVRQLDEAHFRDRLRADTMAARSLMQRQLATGPAAPDYHAACRDAALIFQARVSVYEPPARLLGDSAGETASAPTAGDELAEAMRGRAGYTVVRSAGDRRPVHRAALPMQAGGGTGLAIRLSRAESLPDRGWVYQPFAAVLPAVLLLAAALLIALGVRSLVRHEAQVLASRVDRLAGGELSQRASASAVADLEPLTEAFNGLAERLETLIRGLQLEKRQWEALFTGMREGIVAVDGEINLLAMNQAARLFLGLPDQEPLIGKPLPIAVRNATLNNFIRELLHSRDTHREAELEIRPQAGEGTAYRLSGVRFDYEPGKPPGALVVLHDITRVRRLETMRRDFVANVSHELKTPITSIKGYIETLQSCLPDEPGHAARFAIVIEEQANRLNAIIDDLLTLSRLEQAEHWVARDFEIRDLRETVEGAIVLCDARLRERQVTVDSRLPSLTLYANHRLLEQAISNLVDNAAKYSAEGSRIEIAAIEEPQHLAIAVTDHGIGIPADQHDRIFERFHRVDKSRDRQTGGTGLGLAIVKHIVRVHGGTVTVVSAPGQGSTFTIRLPRRQPGASQ